MTNEISVNTTFGKLVACVGGDPEFPEILISLRREDGAELSLGAVTDNSMSGCEDALRIAVYADPTADDYTDRFLLSHEDVNSKQAMWQ